MKKKFGYNERFLCIVAALIFVAMFTLPVCAWELWSAADADKPVPVVHICEHCGSEVSE